jgi:hypothetical protein
MSAAGPDGTVRRTVGSVLRQQEVLAVRRTESAEWVCNQSSGGKKQVQGRKKINQTHMTRRQTQILVLKRLPNHNEIKNLLAQMIGELYYPQYQADTYEEADDPTREVIDQYMPRLARLLQDPKAKARKAAA